MKIEILDDHKLQRLLDHPDSATAMKAFGELLRRRDAEIGAFGSEAYRRARLNGEVCLECGSIDDEYLQGSTIWGVCHSHRVRWERRVVPDLPPIFMDDVDDAKSLPSFSATYDEMPGVSVGHCGEFIQIWLEQMVRDLRSPKTGKQTDTSRA